MNGPTLPISQQIHAEKYRSEGESFREAMNRIASALKDNDDHFQVFRNILTDMRFLPAGRVQAAMGSTKRVTAYNCFVAPKIADSFIEGEDCIMDVAKYAATTMRMGGGIGYDFSTLRPRGDLIRKLQSHSSGPVAFMEIFDAICRTVASSGHRRGAQMGVLRVDHPDIVDFLHAKQNTDRLTGFNVSIGITDEFMRAVLAGSSFQLRFQGQSYREIDARNLWEMIMRSTWDWAEPGVLFIDRINNMNNLWYCEEIAATNPCFTGDTRVWTAEYGHVMFRDLVGKTVDVLTETQEGRLVYRTMSNIRKTAENAKLVRVRLDNGTSVRCTPNHRFFLRDGTVREAQDLRPGDSVCSVYRYRANQKGYMRLTNGKHDPLEHHVPFENVEGLGSLIHAHHKNEVRADNRPSNLELKEASRHLSDHMSGDDNPLRRMPDRNPMFLYPDCTRGEKNGRWRDDLSTEEMLTMRSRGMSYANIARALGCSKATVRERILSNHRVVGIDWLGEREDVFCGTVNDPAHRFFVATGDNDGVLVANCGEQPLPPNGACLLGSFNLVKYIRPAGDGIGGDFYFDWSQFISDIPPVVRAMDNVVDRTVYPLPEQEAEAKSKRRMGLGVTGVANAIEALGFEYGTPAFCAKLAEILEALSNEAYAASARLAAEKGSFPKYDQEKYLRSRFVQGLSGHTQDLICKHGIRNSHLISIAPTGTISLSADNVSSGIEPVFSYEYKRTIQKFSGPEETVVTDYGVGNFGIRGKIASEVTPQEHLNVLLATQRYVDSSVSKTCNVPSDCSWEDFKNIYMNAWMGGAKGCTTFRIGGKRFGVLVAQEEGTKEAACRIDRETGRRECE